MTPEKIRDTVTYYHSTLTHAGVLPQRIDVHSSFGSQSSAALLAHALYLADNLLTMNIANQYGKANRHLAALQMCLSFANWYTLAEIRAHNCP